MKKFLIAVIMCVLLFSGCSGDNTIYWGEPIESDGWEFTITDVMFRDQYSTDSTIYKPETGSVFLEVGYSIKNTSKGEKYFSPESALMSVDYDGYVFDYDRGWQLSNVGWVQSGEELKPLSDTVMAKMYFEVPKEVQETTEKELKVIVNLGKKYTFNIRPLDENSIQGKYDGAVEQIKKEEYVFAISKLEELGDFKDSKEQLEIAKEGKRFVWAGYDENIAYFTENREKYEKVPAGQIADLSQDTWDISKYGLPVNFKNNGELYNLHIRFEDIHWFVEGDQLVLDYRKYGKSDKFEIRKFAENKYLLYVNEKFMYTMERPY